MGSPVWCYKEILKDLIRLEKEISVKKSEEELKDKTVEELEEIAKTELSDNYPLKCFYAGFAVSEFIGAHRENGDVINACCGSISMIYDLLNIKEKDDEDEE